MKVVGYIQKPEIDLPKWNGGRYKARIDGKEVVLESDAVRSVCGDILTLRDGTAVERAKV